MAKERRKVTIDGNHLSRKEHAAYRGVGTVSCNNSSRLLMDYKTEHPERYWEIMRWLFDAERGLGLSHVKIELGADINSSSGTEPATKRRRKEPANTSRGAGFMFAADAKKVNPAVTVDLLRWGQVGWVDRAFSESREAGYEARYQWYKETIDAAYDRWGLRFDYISADMNETGEIDVEWIKYLSGHLKQETTGRYDYGSFRIVASDEVGSLCIADAMLEDEELRNAVDVISSHYNTKGNENTRILTGQYGKEVWYSEGSAPMNDAGLYAAFDGSGLTGINGTLDIANRMINMYYNGEMTMYEFQPAVAAYYDGVQYFPKQLICANTPWSGCYHVGSGAAMVRHFTAFIRKGWRYVEDACFGDGNEEHYITDTTHNYLTCAEKETGDYSMVICNDSDTERNYEIEVKNLKKQAVPVQLWETRGPEQGQPYDACYLRRIGELLPEKQSYKEGYTYTITVRPYSLVTLTTTTGQKGYRELMEESHASRVPEEARLLLPYNDNFTYRDSVYQTEEIRRAGGYHVSRGGTPRYMTDQYGAFEVIEQDGKMVLQQQITEEIMPSTWRFGTLVADMDIEDWEAQEEKAGCKEDGEPEKTALPDPKVCFGDDTWCNYQVSAKIAFAARGTDRNYVGIGVRCNLSMGLEDGRTREGAGQSGYWLKISRDGRWRLNKAFSIKLAEGTADILKNKENEEPSHNTGVENFTEWIPVKLKINRQHLVAYIAGQKATDIQIGPAWTGAGKVSLYSAYYKNGFADIEVLPLQEGDKDFPEGIGNTYIDRVDAWDKNVGLERGFRKKPSQSWMYYNRVCIEGDAREGQPLPALTFSFKGTGLHIVGETEPAVLRITMDGEITEESFPVTGCAARMTSYACYGLSDGRHTIHIEVLEGSYRIDAFEILISD